MNQSDVQKTDLIGKIRTSYRRLKKHARKTRKRLFQKFILDLKWNALLLRARLERYKRASRDENELANAMTLDFLARELKLDEAAMSGVSGYFHLDVWVAEAVRSRTMTPDQARTLARILAAAGCHRRACDVNLALWRANLNQTTSFPDYLSTKLKSEGSGKVLSILDQQDWRLSEPRFAPLVIEILSRGDAEGFLSRAGTPLLLRILATNPGSRSLRDRLRKDLLQRIRSLNSAALAFLARERGWTVDELQMRLQEPDRRKDPQSLLDEAVLRPARELDLKLQDILRSGLLPRDPETARDQFKGDPEALRALRMAESFTGFHEFKGMFSPAAQPGSPELPAARSGVLVISAGDLSAEVRAGLGGGQPRTHHVAIQANKGDTRLRDIVVPHNSPIDHEAAHQAGAFGLRVADRIFKAASPELRGAWALSLADRMFGQFKRGLSLVDFQRQENCDKALIVLEKGNWEQMFSLACALESAGGEVWVVWSAMEAPARQQLLSHWLRSGAATPLELLIRQQKLTPMGSAEEIWAAAALDRIAQAREPEPGFGGPLLNQGLIGELEDRILQEKSPLMMAGLGDPSYFAAMQSLLAKVEERGRRIVALDTNWAITSPANDALKGVCPGVALTASLAGMEAAAVEAEQEFLRFCEDLDPASLDPGALMTIPRMYGVLRNVMSDCAIEMIAARRLLEKKPACFISLPGRAPEIRAATIIARENGVRSIDLQAFYISSHPRYKSSLADVYCAITTDQADLYKRHLDPPENQRIEVTGSLAMDQRLSRVRGMSKEEARNKLNWAKDDRILLFGAQHGSGKEGRRILDLLIGMVETWPGNWRLVIKLHPREAQSVEQDMIDAISALGKRNQISVHRSESIYDLIVGSDVVVTQFSNIGLEAAVLGKPVLAVNFTENEYAVDLAEIGVAERMSTEGELHERVKSLMSIYGSEYESIQRDDYFKMNEFLENGGSTDRIMFIIENYS